METDVAIRPETTALAAPAPPSNIEAEAVVIGAMLIDNVMIDRVSEIVSAADFFEPLHARLFQAIVRQFVTKGFVSPITIKPEFETDEGLKQLGGLAYLAGMTADPTAQLFGLENAHHVKELSNRRRMMTGLNEAVEACRSIDIPETEIIALADAAISQREDQSIVQVTAGQCVDDLIKRFDEDVPGVTCGQIPELDRALGPIRPKQLVVCAGRPGMGKSAVAISYAVGATKNGHGVLFVSLEMSGAELASRIASDLCYNDDRPIPFAAIDNGRLDEWQKRQVIRAGSYLHTIPLNIIDAGSLTIGRLSMLIRRHKRRMAAKGQKLELVVVDYLQLLRTDHRAKSNYEAVSEISIALKGMAKDHEVGIMALCQLSRAVETRNDKRPMPSDLRDSGQIEQDADAILFLLREEYYLRKSRPAESSPDYMKWEIAMEEAKDRIEFIVAKRRNGVEGTAIGEFHGAYQAVR